VVITPGSKAIFEASSRRAVLIKPTISWRVSSMALLETSVVGTVTVVTGAFDDDIVVC